MAYIRCGAGNKPPWKNRFRTQEKNIFCIYYSGYISFGIFSWCFFYWMFISYDYHAQWVYHEFNDNTYTWI